VVQAERSIGIERATMRLFEGTTINAPSGGFLLIPAAKQDAVTRALEATFGVSEFDDLQILTEGLSSALVFRMVVKGCPYLLPHHHAHGCDG
jgi:hypothetical protein